MHYIDLLNSYWLMIHVSIITQNINDVLKFLYHAQQLDEALERAKIDNELIESLNEGLRSFGELSTR